MPDPTILNATKINFRDRFLTFFLHHTRRLKMQYATFASTQLSPVKRLWMTQGGKVHKLYASEDLTDWKFGKWTVAKANTLRGRAKRVVFYRLRQPTIGSDS
jgi:hypothetical protein